MRLLICWPVKCFLLGLPLIYQVWFALSFFCINEERNLCVFKGGTRQKFSELFSFWYKNWYSGNIPSVKKLGINITMFELTYCDLGNTMYFSFFTIQFFPTTLKINTKECFCFLNGGTETKFFLAVNKVKSNFNMIRIWFLLKLLCCSLDIRFFSLILIRVSFCNSSQLYVGPNLESKGMHVFFRKRVKKGKIFKNLCKNVQNLKIFWKRAGDCLRLSHAVTARKGPRYVFFLSMHWYTKDCFTITERCFNSVYY